MTPQLDADEALTKRLHTDHGDALFGWAVNRMADRRDAEEIVAETLVRAWRRYHQFDPGKGSERAWIFGIARNTSIDMHRKSMRRLQVVTDEVPEDPDHGGIDQIAEISLISDALNDLAEAHRTVIIEAFYAGRSTREIAERLGVPAGTVKSRMYYAMRNLRVSLQEREVLR